MIKTVVTTLLFLLAAALGLMVYVMFSGVYNIAATEPHTPLFKWAVHVTMKNSVKHHAGDIEVPENLAGRETSKGFAEYDEMCVGCHGAPGVEPLHFTRGLNPEPPDLVEEAAEWKPAQLYWIIAHGIKMTGMPGIVEQHSEEEIWDLTAFVSELPTLTPEAYASLKEQTQSSGHSHAESGHEETTDNTDNLGELFGEPEEKPAPQ